MRIIFGMRMQWGGGVVRGNVDRLMERYWIAAIALCFVTGCVHVAPYERGTLAHPTMTVDDVSTAMDEHVRAVSEGATGGVSGGGGGCGCN
jgi:hypothetical protein